MKYSKKEIDIALRDCVKYKILKKGKKGFSYDKKNLSKLAEGIKTNSDITGWIRILYKAGYFRIGRTEREIAVIVSILNLKGGD